MIITWVLFIVVKAINRLRRKEAAAPTASLEPTKEEVLQTETRDLVARRA